MKASDEKYTPEWALSIPRRFAPILLDVAAPPHNPVGAPLYCVHPDTFDQAVMHDEAMAGDHRVYSDGLKQSWSGLAKEHRRPGEPALAWLQPPYSRHEGVSVETWVAKCHYETQRTNLHVIGLLTGDSSTDWWRLCMDTASGVHFYDRRIPFEGGSPGDKQGAKFCSHYFYWGNSPKRFLKACRFERGDTWNLKVVGAYMRGQR